MYKAELSAKTNVEKIRVCECVRACACELCALSFKRHFHDGFCARNFPISSGLQRPFIEAFVARTWKPHSR